MAHPFLMVWLLLMIRYEFVYVYFITTKNVGDYSYMSSPNIYYRAFFCIIDIINYSYERLEYKFIIQGITYYIIKIIKANDGYVVESSACTYFMWIVNISKGKTYSIGVDTY